MKIKASKNSAVQIIKKTLNKFTTYEQLINEFIDTNPNYTDMELNQACLFFATQCGLTVAAKAKEKMAGSYD